MRNAGALAKFAAFVLVCLLAAGWLVVTIGNISLDARHHYEAVFSDVRGLAVNDAVKVAGVPVGKVTSIEVQRGEAVVGFDADEELELSTDTTVSVRWRNTIGLRFVYLTPGDGQPVTPGHRFPSDQTAEPADLNTLLGRLTPVMDALDPELANVVVQELARAIGGREQELRRLVDDAGTLLSTLASRGDAIDRTLTNGATLLDAYAARTDELERLVGSFAEVSDTLASRNDVLVTAIDELADVEAELSRLLETNDADIRGLIDELDEAAAVLSVNHENLESILTYTGRGIVNYHRISRDGQWFNIRVPGLSVGERPATTERGAALPPRSDDGSSAATLSGPSWGAVFGLPAGGGGPSS